MGVLGGAFVLRAQEFFSKRTLISLVGSFKCHKVTVTIKCGSSHSLLLVFRPTSTVCCQGFSDWRGFFLTEALVQFLFEFRLQRIDVASVASGVSVF